jgi:starch-binding outer membrane protein, SusD/RagB family
MLKLQIKKNTFYMQLKKYSLLFAAAIALTTNSCTKLDEKVYDQFSADGFPANEQQLSAVLGSAYSSLGSQNRGGIDNDYFFLQECATDEIMVPTRGTDWDDNGQWRELWLQTWTKNHNIVDGGWGFCAFGLGTINRIEAQLKATTIVSPSKDQGLAELKVLRALYHWMLMDLYGKVPIVRDFSSDPNSLANKPRSEVFAYIESEINSALPALSTNVNSTTYGRMTRYVAQTLLAKLYLNAQVYTGTAKWTECIAACDAVISSGKYSLNNNFFASFAVDNFANAQEIILAVPTDKTLYGPGDFDGTTRMQLRTLHYTHRATFNLGETPWNGFCSNADFYNKFNDPNDKRKAMFLVGQQFDATGAPLLDGATPVVLTASVSSVGAAGRSEGARSIKYAPESGSRRQQSNDFVIFRYADVLMMKAEATARNANNWNLALPIVNQIRARANAAALVSITADGFLDERAREFAWEGWRRNDMVRFDKFTAPKQDKPGVSPSFRNIYPIPQRRIDANAQLTQNPGY